MSTRQNVRALPAANASIRPRLNNMRLLASANAVFAIPHVLVVRFGTGFTGHLSVWVILTKEK